MFLSHIMCACIASNVGNIMGVRGTDEKWLQISDIIFTESFFVCVHVCVCEREGALNWLLF